MTHELIVRACSKWRFEGQSFNSLVDPQNVPDKTWPGTTSEDRTYQKKLCLFEVIICLTCVRTVTGLVPQLLVGFNHQSMIAFAHFFLDFLAAFVNPYSLIFYGRALTNQAWPGGRQPGTLSAWPVGLSEQRSFGFELLSS